MPSRAFPSYFLSSRTTQNHWNSPRYSRIDIFNGFSSRFFQNSTLGLGIFSNFQYLLDFSQDIQDLVSWILFIPKMENKTDKLTLKD